MIHHLRLPLITTLLRPTRVAFYIPILLSLICKGKFGAGNNLCSGTVLGGATDITAFSNSRRRQKFATTNSKYRQTTSTNYISAVSIPKNLLVFSDFDVIAPRSPQSSLQPLFASVKKNEDGDIAVANENVTSKEGGQFDGSGLASYLAPYAVAFLASIVATAAFLQFILIN